MTDHLIVRASDLNCRFPFGQVFITDGVAHKIKPMDVALALRRHGLCDWGDLVPDDIAVNDCALLSGERLLSAYHDRFKVKFWIITDADRSATTVLLPEEY